MKNYFDFKEKIKIGSRSLLVYKFKSNNCNVAFTGKTKRHHGTCTPDCVSALNRDLVKNNS